jgi:zinc and cadmium transporter
MDAALWYTLAATFLVSLISLIGIFFIFGKWWNDRIEMRLVSFAAGVLLGTAFLDLLPEALEHADGNTDILIASLVAMAVFFFTERLLHGLHHHGHDETSESHVRHHSESRYFILVGDGAHNFVDGVAIGSAFLIDTGLGVVTTLAVMAHEIPHEVADYSVLVHGGYTRGRALWYNFLSGLTAVLGGAAVYIFGAVVEDHLAILLAASAGMFLYIASANLIPELHHQRIPGRFIYGTPFLLGIAVMILLTSLLHA